jgi:putative DNA primase/helicase
MTTSYSTGGSFASDFTEDSGKSSANSFDIRDHLDKLEPGKGKNKYTCPVCGGRNLSVAPKTGQYKCWSGDCSSADIREAIRPLAEFLAQCKGERPARIARKPKAKKKEYPPTPIAIGAKLLRLPAPGKPPRAERPKYFPQGAPYNAVQITYTYSSTQKVLRFEWSAPNTPKGRDKTYRQVHIDPKGNEIWNKGDARWPAYLINEIVELLKSIPDGEPIIILIVEGEPNVELARLHGIAALTLQGSNWSHPEIQIMLETLRATGKNVSVAVLRDNDDTGIKKGQEVSLVARHIQFPCIVIDPRVIYPDIPEKGDIQEILEAIGPDEFLSRMNSEIASQAASIEPRDTSEPTPISFEFERETKYTQTLRLTPQQCNRIPNL